MIVVLSGSNRPEAHTRRISQVVRDKLAAAGAEVALLDLQELPPGVFEPTSYGAPPPAFLPWKRAILEAHGLVTVVPEYNGSFPGALKYFVDLLDFPASLKGLPTAFVGLAAGEWGGLRAVEQLELVYQYRQAHLFGTRVFIRRVQDALAPEGGLRDAALEARLDALARGFVAFCRQLRT